MKIFLRRVPFFTQQLLGWAYLVFWVLKIVSPEIQVQLSHLPRLVYDLLLFVTLNAFIQVLSALRRRKKATQFLSTLPTQFYETVHTLSAMPIVTTLQTFCGPSATPWCRCCSWLAMPTRWANRARACSAPSRA